MARKRCPLEFHYSGGTARCLGCGKTAPARLRANPQQSHLEQLTDARMREISDMVASGVTAMTGRAIVDEEGRVIGRHGGGFFKTFPELAGTRRRPGEIAKAIDRGHGKVYDEIRGWVREGMADYAPAPRPPEKPIVKPHQAKTAACKKCGIMHGKGAHRFHGKDAFHKTHLWGFPKLPPLTNPSAPAVRIGRVVEVRYMRDQGQHRGYYKHVFRRRAGVWTEPNGTVTIR